MDVSATYTNLPALASDPDGDNISPAREWELADPKTGTEPPDFTKLHAEPRTVVRSFVFFDLCASTALLEEEGPLALVAAVNGFREILRAVCAERGVRVAKWLGDGAMCVATKPMNAISTAVDVTYRCGNLKLPARAGVSVSKAVLFDGDDYIGRGANFAARICDAAPAGHVLCDPDCLPVPSWVTVLDTTSVELKGMGDHTVCRLGMASL